MTNLEASKTTDVFPAPAGTPSDTSAFVSTLSVFPAPAGMTRISGRHTITAGSVPRPRGDDPLTNRLPAPAVLCSPPPRG